MPPAATGGPPDPPGICHAIRRVHAIYPSILSAWILHAPSHEWALNHEVNTGACARTAAYYARLQYRYDLLALLYPASSKRTAPSLSCLPSSNLLTNRPRKCGCKGYRSESPRIAHALVCLTVLFLTESSRPSPSHWSRALSALRRRTCAKRVPVTEADPPACPYSLQPHRVHCVPLPRRVGESHQS